MTIEIDIEHRDIIICEQCGHDVFDHHDDIAIDTGKAVSVCNVYHCECICELGK